MYAHARVCVCVCAAAGQAAARRRGEGDEETRGTRGTRGVVMVRGKEGKLKRACKRALAISVRVAPARK